MHFRTFTLEAEGRLIGAGMLKDTKDLIRKLVIVWLR